MATIRKVKRTTSLWMESRIGRKRTLYKVTFGNRGRDFHATLRKYEGKEQTNTYQVFQGNGEWNCTCPDYQLNYDREYKECKHISMLRANWLIRHDPS